MPKPSNGIQERCPSAMFNYLITHRKKLSGNTFGGGESKNTYLLFGNVKFTEELLKLPEQEEHFISQNIISP